MIKVECPGCKAPYQVDERRVPDVGLKMRCPKCATSFVVTKPGAPAAKSSPTGAPPKPAASAPKAAPRVEAPAEPDWDLPAPAAAKSPFGAPPGKRQPPSPKPAQDDDDMVDLPVARGPAERPFAPARAPAKAAKPGGGAFGEIDLLVDLPSPEAPAEDDNEIDLPVARPAPPRGAPVGVGRPVGAPAAKRAAADTGTIRARTQLFGDTVPDPAAAPSQDAKAAPIRVPVPARDAAPPREKQAAPAPKAAPRQAAPSNAIAPPPPALPQLDDGLGFGEIDLPQLAPDADLPSPSERSDLPAPAAGLPVRAPGAGLPVAVSGAGLPSPVEGAALPVRQQPGLPAPAQGSTLPVATDGTTLPVRGQRKATPMAEGFDRASDLGFGRASDAGPGRVSDLGFGRASDAGPGRTSEVGAGRTSDAAFRADADGPKVHGPGHIAGADIYSGAVYDDRHMDPAFRTEARSVVTKLPQPDPEEAPFVTTSGRSIRDKPTVPDVSVGRAPTARGPAASPARVPDPEELDPWGDMSSGPAEAEPVREPAWGPRAPTAPAVPQAKLGRGPGMADLIDRTSIELDLIEPSAPPTGSPPAAARPQASSAMAQGPMSVPDLAAPLDTPPPPPPRFDVDPLSDPGGEAQLGPDAGTEVPLGAIDDGEEADLEGRAARATAVPKLPVAAPPPAADTAPKRSWRKLIVVAAVAGLFSGALLTLVPDVGPFGLNFISDRVNKDLHNNALDASRAIVQSDLEADTSAGADRAIAKMKTAQRAYPRHRATAGYAAYVAFQRILRFGPGPEEKAYGDMMLRVAQDRQTDFLALGQAAQDAATGQVARARQTIQGLIERRPDDIDVAVLAGEIELLTKSGDQAVKAWQRAVTLKKDVPRTLFGLARAQYAAGDLLGAEGSARGTLDLSSKHVGARTLLASIVWQNGGREQQALELLSKVTEDGEIRATASEPEKVAAYTQLGHIHLAKSRMSQAEQAFAAALKIDPQAVQALVGNGELFYRSGRYSEAVARYEAAIRADADSVPAKVGMAKTLLFLERAKDAKDLLKKLCETRPNEPLAFYWLGRAEESLGNKKEAEAAYANAIKVGGESPQTVEAFVALAQLLSSLGRADDANARLVEAASRFPGQPALHRARGEVALSAGNYDEAKKELEAALTREDDISTRFKLGSVLRRMRLFEEAAKIFDAIAESDKDFPGLALERGMLFEETGQSDRASEMYAKALQSAPNDLDLKLRVGSTQVMAGHAKQAEPILREVHKAKPNSAEVNHFLGRALLLRGTSLAEAKRYLERAAEIDPNRAEYHLYIGWVANELGETPLAESALRRAIELDRNLGDAYWQRGVLLQKQGQALDALNDLTIALEKSPSRFEIHATMAYCFQDQSKWAEAEESWKKAIAGNDQVADWHYRLGKVYFTRGNRGLATPELDKAVTLADVPDKATPGWLAEAHFLLGEAFRSTNKEKAKHHYNRFKDLAPQNHPYRVDAERALQGL